MLAVIKKDSILLLTLIFVSLFIANITYGQSNYLSCAYQNASLKKAPSKKAGFVQGLDFGERVVFLGEETYVSDEKITYIKVESMEQKVGWVPRFLFVENASQTVLLEEAQLFARPNTPSSISLKKFEAGELILRGTYKSGWVFVTSKNKEKIGWIESNLRYSQTSKDLALANQWASIKNQSSNSNNRIRGAVGLIRDAQNSNSPLAEIFLRENQDAALELAEQNRMINARLTKAKSVTRDNEGQDEEKDSATKREQKLVWNPIENNYFTEIVETGPAIPVENTIEYTTPFYAYHKSLELGTEVRMDLPDNGGFVQLVIMGRLDSESPAILALPPVCLSSIFGTLEPGDIVISYKKP